jgi:hypothetical protein
MKADKALAEWASTWKRENLSVEMRQKIQSANFDLYQGPVDGFDFTTACREIREALDLAPWSLWWDEDAEGLYEDKPGCTCKEVPEDEEQVDCFCFDSLFICDRKAILSALVGKELVEYVR